MSYVASQDFQRASPSDAEAVRALVRDAYARWEPVIGREPMPMTVDYDQAVRAHEIDLLLIDGVLVGLIEMIPAVDHLFIENVAVTPLRQGQGYGRRLLEYAEARAAASGLPELRLLTNGAFESNIRLYQAVGFTISRTEPFRGGLTVYMEKPLAQGSQEGS